MSKHVHPMLFRRGYPSTLSDAFKRGASERSLKLFERDDSYRLDANVKFGMLGRKVQQCSMVEKTLVELFQKSGYLVESITFRWENRCLIVKASLYHRMSTSSHAVSENNVGKKLSGSSHSTKVGRRLSWTIRTLQWRSLLAEDLDFYKTFFSKYLGLTNEQFILNVQMVSAMDFQDSSCYQGLLMALQPVQKQSFFHDTVALMCRASKEPSAELLVRLLQMELGYLRNQQTILDALSQGLQYILQLDDSHLKAFLIKVSGRINGSDRAKTFQARKGSIPLHTLRAPIDYAFAEVRTKYGILSLKIYLRY